ncbi:MAG: SEFIR domain-containing protein [Actinomycetota bacterium]
MATVFLSYRHEDDPHRSLVRGLAERLEKEGLTVVFDQFAQEREFNSGGPNEGWPRWSKAQAGAPSHKVLIVGSPGWFRAYEQTEVPGKGLGAAAEAGVIEQRLYNVGGVSPDIRIVAFARIEDTAMPIDLQRYHRFLDPADFAGLVHWLTGIAPAVVAVEDWPDAPPALSWVMADHDGVRAAFPKLITRTPDFRYLPIRGPSESGKSHITRQLLGNALRCAGLACGRFDFKGTTDADAELQRFVQNLEVPMPAAAPTLTQRLSAVLGTLIARKRPALLIFDTFEAAGEAEQWVKEHLLVALIRQPWLRVVIAGQHVPERAGAAWDAEASPAVILTEPGPEHWLTFGQQFKPGVTIDFVREAHKLCGGKASLLGQMLGPSA